LRWERNLLTSAGPHVGAYDQVAIEEAEHQLGNSITYCNSYLGATEGAGALAMITEWTEFHVPDKDKVAETMNGKVLFYGRNLYHRETLAEIGFDYYGIGN
jgi:UDPglucose 6-dehydrogenase